MEHKFIVRVHDSGKDGVIKKPIGKPISGLYYLVMDYVPCGMLYDVVEHFNGVGETVARYFFKQIIEARVHVK